MNRGCGHAVACEVPIDGDEDAANKVLTTNCTTWTAHNKKSILVEDQTDF